MLTYHYEVSHADQGNPCGNVLCSHEQCKMSFKTLRQKIMHHNNLETECKTERINLIELIAQFKKSLKNLKMQKCLIDKDIDKFKDYINLKNQYEHVSQNLFDSDAFYFGLGEDFLDIHNFSDD